MNLYNVRVCGSTSCAVSAVIAGLDWVSANHINPAVANLSLWGPTSTSMDKAVRRSIAAGVLLVTIAGNNGGDDAINYSPSRVTQAVTVGATDSVDSRASFSNIGSVLDVFPPGVQIPSSANNSDTATFTDDGTSFAAPHVTGAAARYLQIDSTACSSTVSEIISSLGNPVVANPGQNTTNKVLFTPVSWPAPTYYSLSLNGTSAYVDVPNAGLGVSLDFPGPVTVEAWVKLNSNTVRQTLVEKYNPSAGAGTNDGGYGLRLLPSGKIRFFTFKNAVEYSFITGNTVLSTGTWYHVAGVFDGSQLKIYVQGVSDATPVSATYPPQTGISNLKIGVSPEGSYFLNGLIDEFGWLHKAFEFRIKSKKSTTLYIVIGIWGTQQARRVYNLDSVCVSLIPE